MRGSPYRFTDFSMALSFLTVFPTPWFSASAMRPEDLAKSFAFYPLVGGILGSCWFLAGWGLSSCFPPLLLAAVVTAFTVVLTRGLHMDGLADMADGLGGGFTPEKRLEIMKDSHIGAFGTLALILTLALKMAAFHAILTNRLWPVLLITPAFSRFGMVLLATSSPYARPSGGLGKPFLDAMRPVDLITAATFLILVTIPITLKFSLLFAGGTFLAVAAMKGFSGRFLGGVTGDVLGATNEIIEVLLLTAGACFSVTS